VFFAFLFCFSFLRFRKITIFVLLSKKPNIGKMAKKKFIDNIYADVVKLVDTPDLGSGASRRAGSSPSIRTFSPFFYSFF
jgi:hypothetical protein